MSASQRARLRRAASLVRESARRARPADGATARSSSHALRTGASFSTPEARVLHAVRAWRLLDSINDDPFCGFVEHESQVGSIQSQSPVCNRHTLNADQLERLASFGVGRPRLAVIAGGAMHSRGRRCAPICVLPAQSTSRGRRGHSGAGGAVAQGARRSGSLGPGPSSAR